VSGLDEAGRPEVAGVRERLALALDVSEPEVALDLAKLLSPVFGVAKVGLELWASVGPAIVGELEDIGFGVFVDLKCHDIPTTVGRAAKAAGAQGARWLTVHAAGGRAMLEAAVSGFAEGSSVAGGQNRRERGLRAGVLAVTVLTSDPDAASEVLIERARLAQETGCAGIVAAASDLGLLAEVGAELVRVVPGIRPVGSATDDQARSSTPGGAVAAGADLLVVGRAVTRAADPLATALAIAEEMAGALAVGGDGSGIPSRRSSAR